jgi:hypothetical protein
MECWWQPRVDYRPLPRHFSPSRPRWSRRRRHQWRSWVGYCVTLIKRHTHRPPITHRGYETCENVESVENVENVESVESVENVENVESVESAENVETFTKCNL